MTFPAHTKIGLVDLDAFADGEPLSRAQLRQLYLGTNALAITDYPVMTNVMVDNDVTTVNSRVSNDKTVFWDEVGKTWNIAPPWWEQLTPEIPIMYPPGFTQGTLRIRLGLMTGASLKVRAQTSATYGDYSYQSQEAEVSISGRTNYTTYTLTVPLNPSGRDFLSLHHRTTKAGAIYAEAAVADFGWEINRRDWFSDSDYSRLNIATARSANNGIFAVPANATHTGENLQELGAIIVVEESDGGGGYDPIWPMKRVSRLEGSASVASLTIAEWAHLEPAPTDQEAKRVPSPVLISAYEAAIWACSGWHLKASIAEAYQ